MPIDIRLPAMHSGQVRLLKNSRRFNIACCGRRFGKTYFGIDYLVAQPGGALDGYPTSWFAPTYKVLDDAWRKTLIVLEPVIKRTDNNQKRVELITGGAIDYWSLDMKNPARGREYRKAVVDEAAMDRHLWENWNQAIRPTLIRHRGGAWFMSTPKGMNDFKRLWDYAEKRPESWARHHAPTHANPYIPREELEDAKADMPELDYRQEILAEFIDLEGALMRREFLRYGRPPLPEFMEIVIGVDLAISEKTTANYTSICVLGRVTKGEDVGRIWVLEVVRFRGPFNTILNHIKSMAAKWNPKTVGIENQQFQAAVVQELLRTTTLNVQGIRADRDKVTRFHPLLARYEQGLVYHVEGISPQFEAELLSFPIGENDDMVDSVSTAYATFGLRARFAGSRAAALA